MADETAPMGERELLELALALPHDERDAFLDERCRGDEALRRRVARLLDAHERADGFTGDDVGLKSGGDSAPAPGRTIGPYRLIEPLGEGGMGTVYLAEQTEPIRRQVALKVIRLGMDTEKVVARFEAERQTLALMDHPGIARVFDAGAADEGRPYFAMELVRGVPITEHCDRARLSTAERLDLFVQVCNAVQHAHRKGIIHRDLKPSNVLVTADDPPLPKVIDFGIAKATAEAEAFGPDGARPLLTLEQQILGTPEYMSPEQAGATPYDVDTRSDVYSLGVILYELLTGSRPLDLVALYPNGLQAVLHHLAEVEPERPSTRVSTKTDASREVAASRGTRPELLARQIRGDLDWVVLKALAKDRDRRYDSAAALGADVRRYLAHEPVEAGPPSALYRATKFARRHRIWIGAAAVALVALAGGVGALAWSLGRVREERDDAVDAREAERAAKVAAQDAREAEEAERLRAERSREAAETERERAEDALVRAEDERDEAEEVTRFLTGMLQSATADELGRDLRVGTLLHDAEGRLERELVDRPQVRARLGIALGVAYEALGEYERAAELLERSTALRLAERGPDDHDTLYAQNALGIALWQAGRLERANEVLSGALEHARDALGPYEHLTLQLAGNLAIVTRARGFTDEAETLYKELVATCREHLGEDHASTLNMLHNLVVFYIDQRRGVEAEATLSEIFERLGPTAKTDDPAYLLLLLLQAQVHEWRGRFDAAEALYRKGVALQTEVLGPEHPDTLDTIKEVARFLVRRGRYDEAEPLLEEIVALAREVQGEEHPKTLSILRSYASLLYSTARFAEAQALFEEVHDAYGRILGPEHPQTVDAANMLAIQHFSQGHYAEAERFWVEYHDAVVATKGRDHKDTIIPLGNLAMVRSELGRQAEAEEDYRQALERCLAVHGPESDWTLNIQNNLAIMLQRVGRFEEAVELNEAVIGQRVRTLGPDHPDTLGTRNNLASCLNELGRLEEARAILGETLPRARATVGARHPTAVRALQTSGIVAYKLGELDEAEAQLEEAYEHFAATVGEDKLDTLVTREMLALVARDRGELEQARGLFERLVEDETRALGRFHVNRLATLGKLARTRRDLGDEQGARELEHEVRSARLQLAAAPGASPDELRRAAELLLEAREEGDAAYALELTQRLALAADVPNVADRALLARSLAAIGNVERARAIVREALEGEVEASERLELERWLGEWVAE